MREGVAADDGLVGLHVEAGDGGQQLRRAQDALRLDAGGQSQRVVAGAQRHRHLLQRGVARALADAVDGALDLPHAGLHGASVLATASPRSLWLWVEKITRSAPGTLFISVEKISPMSAGSE
jgi:hypothetical protein